MTAGSWASALAICTFWNSPPLMRSAYSRARSLSPISDIARLIMARSSAETPTSMWGFLPRRTQS